MKNFERILLILTFCGAVWSAYNIGFLIPATSALDYQLNRFEQLNAEMRNQLQELDALING